MNILLIPLMLVAGLGLLLCALANLLTWSNQFETVMNLFNEERRPAYRWRWSADFLRSGFLRC